MLIVFIRKGLWVSLTFFDDVFVPAHSLQSPSVFNEEEKLWLWEFDDNKMYMDIDEPVKLRVKDVKFRAVPTAAQLKQQGLYCLWDLRNSGLHHTSMSRN